MVEQSNTPQRAARGGVIGVAMLAALMGQMQVSFAQNQAVDPMRACAALARIFIPASAIGLPSSGAVVQSSHFTADDAPGNPNGEFCAIRGVVIPASPEAPNLEFAVNLPSRWNGKMVQLGGGGYDGTLITGLGPAGMQPAGVPNPLLQGYVTLGSDGGHKGSFAFDGSFGMNDEALLNYGQQSVKKTHDVAMEIGRAHV